jgi:NTP pyrophosphatase (non-canonical NTP hydrolase)
MIDKTVETAKMLNEIVEELKSARKKFPDSEASMVALVEEVGELAKALLDEPYENVRKEAVQVAVMAIRVAVDGDPSLNKIRNSRIPGND